MEGFQKIRKSPRCDMVTLFYHYNDVTEGPAASMRPTCSCSLFILQACEIDLQKCLNYSIFMYQAIIFS